MFKKSQLWCGLVLMLAPFAAHATADTPAADPQLPQINCPSALTDIQGDAAPDYTTTGDTKAAFGNQPSLDILQVNLRLTAEQLQVFLEIDQIDPGSMPNYQASWRYTVTFSMGGKKFEYGYEIENGNLPSAARPSDWANYPKTTFPPGSTLANSTAVMRPGTSPAHSWIIFTSPRSEIVSALGAPIAPTDTFTGLGATTFVYLASDNALADNTSATAPQTTVVAGDDSCFGPPPTSIGSVTAAPAQYSDSSTMSAVLHDQNGKPLAGKILNFTIGGGSSKTMHATTDSNGKATVKYGPIAVAAGTYPVTVTFPGDASGKTSTATGTIKVSAEVSLFKPLAVAKSGAKRVVTATLIDNDRTPIAGAVVTWWVNGKKVASGKTNSAGKVAYSGAKPGQSVQAKFAGWPGMVLASASKAVKV